MRYLIGCLIFVVLLSGCGSEDNSGTWDVVMNFEDGEYTAVLRFENKDGEFDVAMNSMSDGKYNVEKIEITGNQFVLDFNKWDDIYGLKGVIDGNTIKGDIYLDGEKTEDYFSATKQSGELVTIDRSKIEYLLSDEDVMETEQNIDHAGLIEELNQGSIGRGRRIYNSNCINCHGTQKLTGSIPTSLKFWKESFKTGSDPFSMYQTITKGFVQMPPQVTMTPREKYDVIAFIRERLIADDNEDQYYKTTSGYLAGLPKGDSKGPKPVAHTPWSNQDYGSFLINTYELLDTSKAQPRPYGGGSPVSDEDLSTNNFAYKGIAVRLDKGDGGVAKGKAWMIFDHDVMRVAGGWTGDGFIDWDAILLNNRHNTYPRTIGKLHFETPVGPGWANPASGSFDDPRFTARDGRQFGPLPKSWANYKGIYHHGDNIIISYSVGSANVLEQLGVIENGDSPVFTRTLNITAPSDLLKMKVAPISNSVQISGTGATIKEEDGFYIVLVEKSKAAQIRLFITGGDAADLDQIVADNSEVETLDKYTQGGPAHYPQEATSVVTTGNDDGMFAVDHLTPPFKNPWNCRMKLSGIDFLKDQNKGVICTTDGDVFIVTGLTDNNGQLKWKRIAAGLFQPLGIKVIDEKIYVSCRDQIVLLRDLNGDEETDFYESFNHDHQVTEHFHEFAMGLQADKKGNLYYAKSGRHAREALVPQHGTLLKVSSDGSKTEILANGFRAANGICINPDGGFLVTDQEGHWNPMNRINWIKGGERGKFFGNMWGYNPPKDTSRKAMEQPMVWVDKIFDRSPAELLWVESKGWGDLNGGLLNSSFGYGKLQWVYHEEVAGQKQGGVIDLPDTDFRTGVMRGRFHPTDGNLYICGMAAWGSSNNTRMGDFYRVRYTGNTITIPLELSATEEGMSMTFANKLSKESALDKSNYEVKTWELIRSSNYGSDRYNEKTLEISDVVLNADETGVRLLLNDIVPVDVMTIEYKIVNAAGDSLKGTVQNTIHNLAKSIAQ
ncbi:MAG: c-type cytochrome [Flavobacteriales bacterium]|nr:c-type cytochrome [Flavobacteriales bacterium]